MFNVITIGSAVRDVFVMSKAMHTHETNDALSHVEACFPFGAKINIDDIFFSTGGGATNNAATFSRLGKFRTAALCRVGDDSSGRDILEGLKKDKVDTSFVQKTTGCKEHTAYSTIISSGVNEGERTILVYRGASTSFNHARIPWQKLKTKWFYISSLGGDLTLFEKILRHAKKIDARVAFNPGGQELAKRTRIMPLFKKLDILILNREEAALLVGKPMKDTKGILKALQSIAPIVIMTDGSAGAYAISKDAAYAIPSVGHKAKNRTGAGDAFGSGFVTGYIKSKNNLMEALRVGSFNADSVVQKLGAKNGILTSCPSQKLLKTLKVTEIKL